MGLMVDTNVFIRFEKTGTAMPTSLGNRERAQRGSRPLQSLLSFGPIIGSLVITPSALMLAIVSAGAGHGSYLPAKVLFPYTMLSTHLSGKISTTFLALAIMQFPLYGVILTVAARFGIRSFLIMCLFILLAHVGAVTMCFWIPIPHFP